MTAKPTRIGTIRKLLARKGGVTLLIGGIVMHWLYQLNCAAAYLTGHFLFWRRDRGAPS